MAGFPKLTSYPCWPNQVLARTLMSTSSSPDCCLISLFSLPQHTHAHVTASGQAGCEQARPQGLPHSVPCLSLSPVYLYTARLTLYLSNFFPSFPSLPPFFSLPSLSSLYAMHTPLSLSPSPYLPPLLSLLSFFYSTSYSHCHTTAA